MKGRIVHADVPHTPGYSPWLDPLCLASNAAVYAVNWSAIATARIRFREPLQPLLEASRASRPLVYLLWHRFNYAATPALLGMQEEIRPTLVMHDGLASRALTHEASAWAGFETFVFRRKSPVPVRDQLIHYVRQTGRHLLNLPDSGGPYGRVKPGVVGIAAACNALIVPFTVKVTPALTVGQKLRHVLPLPFAQVEVRRAEPLEGRTATVEDCQRALEALDRET